ncbi:MAG: hypothetical protein HOH66_08875 [Rhodospirillaceae bacterium]|nr:hypothetical protein [Rhodospirillaceae bacterium]
MRIGPPGRERDGGVEGLRGFSHAARAEQSATQVEMCRSVPWHEADRCPIPRDRVFHRAALEQQVSEIVVGLGVVRVELQGAGVGLGRFVGVPQLGEGDGEVVVALGILGGDFASPSVDAQGRIDVPEGTVGASQAGMSLDGLRREP